jgi:multicomponent Na+:H+ antiporter subunit G
MPEVVVVVLVAALCIGGALFVLVSGVAMFKARDGLSRINVLSAATGMGMPSIAVGAYVWTVHDHGFVWVDLVKLAVAVLGFIIMSSVASNAITRAAYRSGAPLDPATSPNELADPPSR